MSSTRWLSIGGWPLTAIWGWRHFSGPGDGPAEPVIVMRRYPDDTRLASLVKNNEPVHVITSA